mgnify:FL=1
MRTFPTRSVGGRMTEPLSKAGSLRQLSPDVRSKLRSATIVTCVGQLAEELVCNSIDAGAHDISVVIDTGATMSITVSDDGCGMGVADVKLVGTSRYHTSKINSLSDLEGSVRTLGFRGEALASIGDFCVLQVTTRATGSFETYSKICSKVRSSLCWSVDQSPLINLTSSFCRDKHSRVDRRDTNSQKLAPSSHAKTYFTPTRSDVELSDGTGSRNKWRTLASDFSASPSYTPRFDFR